MTKRLVWLGALIVAFSCAMWMLHSLRDDDSTLNVLIRYTNRRMGWYTDRSTGDVIRRMDRYLKKRKFDPAMRLGETWAQTHPDNESDAFFYDLLSDLYLSQAKPDSAHRNEYVDRAMFYRDKALRFQSDNVYCLQKFAFVSEEAGDLSPHQRCPQYRNGIKFLRRSEDMLKQKRQVAPLEKVLSPQGSHNVLTVEDIDQLLRQSDAALKRLDGKLEASGCSRNSLVERK